MEDLKNKARKLGLWNLFLSKEHYPDVGVPLTNLEYATMAEVMGHAPRVAPEACNCSAPDTGNMGECCVHDPPAVATKYSACRLFGLAIENSSRHVDSACTRIS